MQKYVLFDTDENGIESLFKGFYDSDNPPIDAIILNEDQFQMLINEINVNFNLLWYDGENIQIRGKFTKWDNESKSFVYDIDAENLEKINGIKSMAKLAFKKGNLTPYYWNSLSEIQQAQLTTYLDQLKGIMSNIDLPTNTTLPSMPDFLHDLLV